MLEGAGPLSDPQHRLFCACSSTCSCEPAAVGSIHDYGPAVPALPAGLSLTVGAHSGPESPQPALPWPHSAALAWTGCCSPRQWTMPWRLCGWHRRKLFSHSSGGQRCKATTSLDCSWLVHGSFIPGLASLSILGYTGRLELGIALMTDFSLLPPSSPCL